MPTLEVSIPDPSPAMEQGGAAVNAFSLGVIEGFYGRPWTLGQRRRLFAQMREWGMNTYLYAPKEDLKHRHHWRDPYAGLEASSLAALIRDAHDQGVNFVYALAPGLDIVHSSESDRAALLQKLSSVAALGARHFALLFDDIPPQMHPDDAQRYAQRYAGLGEAQAQVTNLAAAHLRDLKLDATLLFCPTEYCARRAARRGLTVPAGVGGAPRAADRVFVDGPRGRLAADQPGQHPRASDRDWAQTRAVGQPARQRLRATPRSSGPLRPFARVAG